jgi:hypothetical protein
MNILQFVSTHVWKALFSKPADSLERSIDHADEFMIVDYEPITSTFCSVPADFGQLSVDAYMSGIICGVLAGAGFSARVTAHSVRLEEGENTNVGMSMNSNASPNNASMLPPRKDKAVFLGKFSHFRCQLVCVCVRVFRSVAYSTNSVLRLTLVSTNRGYSQIFPGGLGERCRHGKVEMCMSIQ